MSAGMTFAEKRDYAVARGFRVIDKEYYNPGGTYYILTLIAPDGSECGSVQKMVKSRSLGKEVTIAVPDETAEAWKCVEGL